MFNSLLGIARQWSREKVAILSLKPLSHIKMLIYRTWAIYCWGYRDSTIRRSRLKLFTHWLRDVCHGIFLDRTNGNENSKRLIRCDLFSTSQPDWTICFSAMDLFKIKTMFFSFRCDIGFCFKCNLSLFFLLVGFVLFFFFAVVCICCKPQSDDYFVTVIINI